MSLSVAREHDPDAEYLFVARDADGAASRAALVRVHVGGEPALLVDDVSGPDPAAREAALRAALSAATADGERLVLARGDAAFWRGFGFAEWQDEWLALPIGGAPPEGDVSP